MFIRKFKYNLYIDIMNVLILIFLAICFTSVGGMTLYNAVEISNKTGAACLDGSPFQFYIWEPEAVAHNVLIYFEETPFGWCVK